MDNAILLTQRSAISKEANPPGERSGRFRKWTAIFSGVWLATAVLLMLLLLGTSLVSCPWLVAVYLAGTVLGSSASFAMYGWDKRKAQAEGWRVSEATLQWLAAFGGWPGAVFGQRVFRHKTQKLKFQILFWLIVCLHVPLIVMSLWSIRFGG